VTKPKAGEPTEQAIDLWSLESLQQCIKTGEVEEYVFARRIWRECRETTLEDAARECLRVRGTGMLPQGGAKECFEAIRALKENC